MPLYQARVTRLIGDGRGILGVEIASVHGRLASLRHRLYAWLAIKLNPYHPKFARKLRARIASIERRSARVHTLRARAGVVVATGGFIYNREMVREFAPSYRPGMPLGTTGCDGSGILLGRSAGGALNRMEQVSAWRFINPPEAFVQGIFVDRRGHRYANERLYGAQLGRAMVDEHRGEGILIIDRRIWEEAREQCRRSTGIHWFQRAPALLNLYRNRKEAPTIEALAVAARIDPESLAETVRVYNERARAGEPDNHGKSADFVQPLVKPPFYAINCSLDSRGFPCPTLTLGGLVVDELTGAVRDEDGGAIGGLYAAGRAAVGVCSNGYVSGLSLADCVFSGRRAGASAAGGLGRL